MTNMNTELQQLKQQRRSLLQLLETSSLLAVTDIPGLARSMLERLLDIAGLTRILVLTYADDRALCLRLGLDRHKRVLTDPEAAFCRDLAGQVAVTGQSVHQPPLVCVPLTVKPHPEQAAETIGVLSAEFAPAYTVTPDELIIFEAVAAQLAVTIMNARLVEKLRKKNIHLQKAVEGHYQFKGLLGESKAMKKVMQLMNCVLDSSVSVLLLGETGTGKEVIAQAIHYHSGRKKEPFVAVNCTAFPESLLESELFGHRRGAFTGAVEDKRGLFEHANGGTIFLDEIDKTPLSFQNKLLRVLETQTLRRVGDTLDRPLDVRVMAAVNRNLTELVESGRFLPDLYYRLNVFPIHVPALRERREDIPILAEQFVVEFNKKLKKQIRAVAPELMTHWQQQAWPGNVRQLKNEVQRLMHLTVGDVLTTDSLPARMTSNANNGHGKAAVIRPLDEVEVEHIQHALGLVKGNKSEAARQLGISRPALMRRLMKQAVGNF